MEVPMATEWNPKDPQESQDIVSHTMLGLIYHDCHKPSYVAAAGISSALALIKYLEKDQILDFADRLEENVARLRSMAQ